MTRPSEHDQCPCFSGRAYGECCLPHLEGKTLPQTAEALMRSRYAAFATQHIDYLEKTLFPAKRKKFDRNGTAEWAQSSEWTGLEILSVQDGKENDQKGIVEFIAHYKLNGQVMEHRENSSFVRENGRWYYVDIVPQQASSGTPKIGRNAPCPCGSGKKYKKCCGA